MLTPRTTTSAVGHSQTVYGKMNDIYEYILLSYYFNMFECLFIYLVEHGRGRPVKEKQ